MRLSLLWSLHPPLTCSRAV